MENYVPTQVMEPHSSRLLLEIRLDFPALPLCLPCLQNYLILDMSLNLESQKVEPEKTLEHIYFKSLILGLRELFRINPRLINGIWYLNPGTCFLALSSQLTGRKRPKS